MMTFYIQIAVTAILITAAVLDMKSGRIPNWFAFLFIGLFGILAITTLTLSAALWQCGFAVGVFAFGLLMYNIAGVGAGAVKLMASAALFMPIDRGFALLGLLIFTMFAIGLVVAIIGRIFRSEDSKWKVLKEPVMPLSLPVCATAMLGMFWLA